MTNIAVLFNFHDSLTSKKNSHPGQTLVNVHPESPYLPDYYNKLFSILKQTDLCDSLISKGEIMKKWECPCGYIYDPEEGDYENGIEPETAFEDLPDSWVCPTCGAEKEEFWEA